MLRGLACLEAFRRAHSFTGHECIHMSELVSRGQHSRLKWPTYFFSSAFASEADDSKSEAFAVVRAEIFFVGAITTQPATDQVPRPATNAF